MQTTRRLRLAILAAACLLLLAQGVGTALLLQRSHQAALGVAQDTANRACRTSSPGWSATAGSTSPPRRG